MSTTPSTPRPNPPGTAEPDHDANLPIFEHGRMVTFKKRHVDPPTRYYFGPDDKLGVAFVCTVAGATLEVGGRILSPDGRIVPFTYVFQNPVLGKWNYFDEPLTEGFLLSIAANSQGATVQRGQMFAQIYSAGQGGAALGNGYVDDAHSLNWPPGMDEDPFSGMGAITRTFPSNPAAGAGYTYTVPQNLAQKIRSITYQFAASAAVANRFGFIAYADAGGGSLFNAINVFGVVASNTVKYQLAVGYPHFTITTTNAILSDDLPDIWLKHGDTVSILPMGMQAGDQLSAIGINAEQLVLDASF